MALRSFLCAFALLSCFLCSSCVSANTPALSVISWLPKQRQFCNVSLVTGALSNCFNLPNVYRMGACGVVHRNQIFITGQNLTTSLLYSMAVNMDNKNIQWATSIRVDNTQPVMMTAYSVALAESFVGGNGYLWAVNATSAIGYLPYQYGLQGSFDQSLQIFWSMDLSSLYQVNVMQPTSPATAVSTPYPIVTVAASSSRQVVYCLAPAKNDTILYMYDAYLLIWSTIGTIKNVNPIVLSASVLDPTESYLTFVATVAGATNLVTVDVEDASIVISLAFSDPYIIMLQTV